MTEAIRHYDEDYESDDWSDDDEQSTSYLNGQSSSPASQAPRPETDWLVLLTRGDHDTATIEDVEPPPPPTPEGMALHSAPPGMRPTILTRVSGGMRRLIALVLFAAVLVGAIAGSVALIASTPWASSLITPPSGKQVAKQARPQPAQAQPAPPALSQPSEPPVSQPAQPSQSAKPVVPGSIEDIQQKGNAAYRAGDYDRAIDLLDNAIQMGGYDAVTYYQLGLAYLAATGRAHSGDDAELAFRSAASLQPAWAAPYRMLAESLLRRGYYQDAIEPARKAVDLDGTTSDAWITLGRSLDGAGQKAQAANAYAQARKLSPAPPANP